MVLSKIAVGCMLALISTALVYATLLGGTLKAFPLLFSQEKSGLANAGQCTDAQIGAKKNPNKILFVSCGGFLQ